MTLHPHHSDSPTLANLGAAFADEAASHVKYLHFATLCREQGDEETARLFEETAKQELKHALAHVELLYPRSQLTPQHVLEMAIEGEAHEYSTMYPSFRDAALAEGEALAAAGTDSRQDESDTRSEDFRKLLALAAKRFAALTGVERRHCEHYRAALAATNSTTDK
ncbi:ferritin family protein [Paludibacterium yongneupense]|uniref:ferritin family protein n=1 Tax=Paludibacterium yongneupense TaxID=400061 RepID=UPI00041C1CAE|nr:ferritin family protein [Paludibacterium yongneupense]